MAVLGATGRFGSAVVQAAKEEGSFEIEPLSSRVLNEKIESPLWVYAGLAPGLSACLKRALAQNVCLVIGTTALTEADFEAMRDGAKTIPLFYSPNFSLGIALMRKLAVEVSKKFHRNAQIDLIDIHHAQKKDAPSGTALWIGKAVEEHHPGPCRFHSLRTGASAGAHSLMFNTAEEKITLSHETHSSLAYGRGVVAAALFLQSQPPGLYGMEDLI